MAETPPEVDAEKLVPNSFKVGREQRPLSTNTRASFVIISLYMMIFCVASFMYWDSLGLKIIGGTSAVGGIFLFVAAFFNTEARGQVKSINPIRSYLLSTLLVFGVLVVLRVLGGLIEHHYLSVAVVYVGLFISLVVFRKAMIHVVTTTLAMIFLFVTIHNSTAIMDGRMNFKDAMGHCSQAVFRIAPVQQIANMLIGGNYMTYLGKVDYRDTQINILATRQVADAEDDELRKTLALLRFVSNEIHYVSDPADGFEYAKKPITTLISGGGDCEDQTLLLCSLLESVGVKTYIAFTDDHVFALVRFSADYSGLAQPHGYIDGVPCYALDPADRDAYIGRSTATPQEIKRVFDVRLKLPVSFDTELTRG